MPIQSRKNNNKYNNNKYNKNKNKRTRKRPLQKGGANPEIVSINDKQLNGDLRNKIKKYITYSLKKPNEFIQIDENIYFFTESDASELYQIIQKNTNGSKASLTRIIKELFKDQFAEEITIFLKKNKINKEVIYKGSDHGFNPNPSNQKEGIPYTLFKFETIKADTKVDNEAKIAPSGDTKVEADETGGAKAYATIMNIVKEALKNIDTFYQIIQNDPDMFLLDKQTWKAIDLTERNLALKYFSEQKKKLLGESNKILESMPKTDTDKGIKTYLNSKEYKDSEFKKLSVEFITQNPYITNDAINKLTFT